MCHFRKVRAPVDAARRRTGPGGPDHSRARSLARRLRPDACQVLSIRGAPRDVPRITHATARTRRRGKKWRRRRSGLPQSPRRTRGRKGELSRAIGDATDEIIGDSTARVSDCCPFVYFFLICDTTSSGNACSPLRPDSTSDDATTCVNVCQRGVKNNGNGARRRRGVTVLFLLLSLVNVGWVRLRANWALAFSGQMVNDRWTDTLRRSWFKMW